MARRIGPLLIAVGAILLWLSSRMTWAIASVEDDKSGFSIVDMIGSFWSLELIALTLVLLVGAVAGAALRRTARRVVAAVCAVAAAAVAWNPVSLLTYGADAPAPRNSCAPAPPTKMPSTAHTSRTGLS